MRVGIVLDLGFMRNDNEMGRGNWVVNFGCRELRRSELFLLWCRNGNRS